MSNKEQALSPLLSLGGPFKCGFFFLIRLAWDSHTRIPILIAIIFMVCDIRMQLEIDIETAVRHLPRHNNGDDEGGDEEDESDFEETSDEDTEAISEEEGHDSEDANHADLKKDSNKTIANSQLNSQSSCSDSRTLFE